MTQQTHTGRCACGAVTFTITGALSNVIACHCRTCRRTSGYFWAAAHADRQTLTIDSDSALHWWASSDFAERGFCDRCGSSLFYRHHDAPHISIAPGALDEPTGLTTAAHICCEEAGDYYVINDDVPQYPGPST